MTSKARHKLFVVGLVLVLFGVAGVYFARQSKPDAPVAVGPSPEEILKRDDGRGHVAGDSIYAPALPAVIVNVAAEQQASGNVAVADISPITKPAVYDVPGVKTQQPAVSYVVVETPPSDPDPVPVVVSDPDPVVTPPVTPPAVPAVTAPTPYVAGSAIIPPATFSIVRSVQEVTLASGETSTIITYATSDASSVIWTPTTTNVVWADGTTTAPLSDYAMLLGFSAASYTGPAVSFQVKASAAALANAGVDLGFTAEDGTRGIQVTATTKLIITLPIITVLASL